MHFRFFFLLLPPPPRPTLFPYTTLFRSSIGLTSASASCGHDLVNVGYQKQAHQYDSAMTPLSPSSSIAQRRGLSSSRACGDEPRCGLEHVCIAAEVIERRLCVDDQAFPTPARGGG